MAAIDAVHAWESSKPFRRARQATRVLALALADASAFLCAELLLRSGHAVPALIIWQGPRPDGPIQVDTFVLLAALFIGARYLAGDYSRRVLSSSESRQTTKALLVTSIPDLVSLIIFPGFYSLTAILCSWLFLIPAIPAFRYVARRILATVKIWRIPSALIGDGSRTDEIYKALSHSLTLGYELRAVMNTKGIEERPITHPELDHGVVTDPADAVRRVLQSGCEQVVIADDDMRSRRFADIIQAFLEADIAVAIIPSLKRLPLAGLTASHLFGKDLLLLEVRDNSRLFSNRVLKRGFDVIGATALLVLLAPFFAAIAAAIRLHDGGPVLYEHERIGRGKRHFSCLKFRTMAVNADACLARWRDEESVLYEEFLKNFKLRDDPRITGPGKWLRRTSLDELPQLVNVLRGEMSLVGPRPVVEQELQDYYGSAAQLYSRVRPGMTGLWQISGRSNTSYEERVTYDEWYILNWSFWSDLMILLQTAAIVATGKGAF